jgi:hypothetical protein
MNSADTKGGRLLHGSLESSGCSSDATIPGQVDQHRFFIFKLFIDELRDYVARSIMASEF